MTTTRARTSARISARISARAALTAAVALAALVSASPPAQADTTSVQRSATVEWLELGPVAQAAGNVHIGRIQAWMTPGEPTVESVYGETFDYTCPAGYVPDGLWLDALPQLDANCTIEDNLILETGDLELRVQGRLRQAHLVGEVGYIHGLAVGAPGSLAVDLTWDAPGAKEVTRQVVLSRPKIIQVITTRQASVTGTIGSAALDGGPETSAGVVQRYKLITRS